MQRIVEFMELSGIISESAGSKPPTIGRKLARVGTPAEPSGYRYNAFISYSHAADGKLAPALRQALHTFAKPWNRLRALNVFQDDANLSATPGLWRSVAQALAQSEFFVLMASPEAARSPWVTKELKYWLDNRSPERILIVETAGDVVWDEVARDFDWRVSTALPHCLRNAFSEEPRHVDLRWARTATDLSLSNPAFRAAVVDIAAPLHKRGKDELIGRDIEEQRRRSTIRRRIILALSILSVIAVGSAIFAVRQRDIAEMQRDEARQQRDLAISRQLAAQASHLADAGQDEVAIERAAAFAIESWRRRTSALATEAAARLLTMLPATRLETGDEGWNAILSADGRYLASANSATARVWETTRGIEVARIEMAGRASFGTSAVTISDSGRIVAFGSPDGTTHVVRIKGDESAVSKIGYQPRFANGGEVLSLALTANGHFLAIAHADRTLRLIELGMGIEVMRLEHDLWVDTIAVSSNGQYIAMGSGVDGNARIRLIDAAAHRTIARLRIEDGSTVKILAFSPNGNYLAGAMWSNKAFILNTRNSEDATELTYDTWVHSVAFSPDSRLLAVGSDKFMRLIETATATEVARIEHPLSVMALAFSHRGDLIATGTDESAVRLIAVEDAAVGARVPRDITVTSLAFSPDDRYLVSRSFDGDVWVTETAHPRQVFRIRHSDALSVMALSPNGRWLATGGRAGTARLVEIASGREVARIVHGVERADPSLVRGVKSIAFSADSRYLATGGSDGVATVVETDSGTVVSRVERRNDGDPDLQAVWAVAISPNGSLLAVGKENGAKGSTILVDISASTEKARFEHERRVEAVAFSPDGRLLATWSQTEVRLIDIEEGTDRARLRLRSALDRILAFSPDGRYLATSGGGEFAKSGIVQVIAVADGAEVTRVVHGDLIGAVAFEPRGRLLATASFDGTARLIDIESGREIDRIEHSDRVTAVAFSPDGRLLATGDSDGVVVLTTIATKSRVVRHVHGSGVATFAFSPDGRWLATGSWDGTARLIETDSGAEVARIAHGAVVHTVAFTPDGRFLATASRDGTAALYWADPQRMFDLLCRKAGRNLSRAEWEEIFGNDVPWRLTCRHWRNADTGPAVE